MKNKKIIISSIIAFAIIIIATVGLLYFLTDIFKTEQQLFYKYISKTQIMDSEFVEKFTQTNKKMLENNSSSKTNIDFEIETVGDDTEVDNTQKIFSIESNTKNNISSKQDSCDLKFIVKGKDLLTLRYLRDDNTYALKIDNILNKYLAVENSNLKELFSKILGTTDTSEIPDSIQINKKQISEEKTEDLKKHIKETYATLIYNNIGKEKFYKESTQDKATVIGATLTNYDLINIYKNILQTLNNDTKILNFIIDTGKEYSNTEELTVENLQSNIQELIKQLEEDVINLEEKEVIKVSLTKTKQDVVTKINIELYTEQVNGYTTIDDELEPKYEKVTNNIEIDFSKSNEVIISTRKNENEESKIVFEYSYDDNKIYFNIKFGIDNGESTVESRYTVSDYNSNNITTNLQFGILIGNMNYLLSINDITTLNEEIQIPKLTTENSAKLNDMTSEEINQLFDGLKNRIIKLYESNSELWKNDNVLNEAQNTQKEYEEELKQEQEALDYYQGVLDSLPKQ